MPSASTLVPREAGVKSGDLIPVGQVLWSLLAQDTPLSAAIFRGIADSSRSEAPRDGLRIAISALERADAALGVVVEQRGEISVRGPAAIARGDVKALADSVRLIANFEGMRR